MFQWMSFWRRKRIPQTEAPEPGAEALAPQGSEQMSVLKERPLELNSKSKGARRLVVVHSTSDGAREAQHAGKEECEIQPALILPVPQNKTSQAKISAEPKRQDHELAQAHEAAAIKSPEARRIAYFTRGSYAPGTAHQPRLVPRDSAARTRRHRSPTRLTTQAESDGAFDCGSSHPPAAQK